MRSCLLLPCALLVLAGCSRKAADETDALLPAVKQRLAERDAKLTRYRIAGTVHDEGQETVPFTFDYRAPHRMKGALGAPPVRTFAWDGENLFEQLSTEKRFTRFKSELPPAKLSGFLTETFAPFTPEGFRAPLVLRSVTAKRATHPLAPQAVELSQKLEGAGGLELVYVLRWPGLDFLAKRTRGEDGTQAEVRVEEEHCDAGLGLCVPKRLTRWVGGARGGETTLTQVELNAPLPNDAFTLTAPEGYDVQSKTLVESAPTGG